MLPCFKFVSMFSMLMGVLACNSDGQLNIAILKYNTMLIITSETIFWTVLQTFLHLSVLGLGYIRYTMTKLDIKVTAFILFVSYLDCSAYYVTIDNPIPSQFLRIQMTYVYVGILIMGTCYFYWNLKILNKNINNIKSEH